MAIWALTKERVEKLLRQVADKEAEIDVLIKLSVKDLWNRDLDDFIGEWRFQLEDDRKRARKVQQLGRRRSDKLKIGAKGPGAKKRKAAGDDPDDSDFGMAKPKKAAAATRVAPKVASAFFKQFSPPAKATTMAKKVVVPVPRAGMPAAVDGTGDDAMEDVVASQPTGGAPHDPAGAETAGTGPSPTRRPRAVARKPVKYDAGSDSDSDNGDDLLGDVSMMVKTVGADRGHAQAGSRPLFSASLSRPGSSAGLHKARSKGNLRKESDLSADETDFSKLVPQTTGRQSMAMTMSGRSLSVNDEEDSDVVEAVPAPVKPSKKAVSKPATKAVPKPAAASKAKKAPAKKAAAAKAAPPSKKKEADVSDDDEVEAMADDLLDSADEEVAAPAPSRVAAARPARRAVVNKKKPAYLDSESEEEEEDDDDDDEPSESWD